MAAPFMEVLIKPVIKFCSSDIHCLQKQIFIWLMSQDLSISFVLKFVLEWQQSVYNVSDVTHVFMGIVFTFVSDVVGLLKSIDTVTNDKLWGKLWCELI